MHDGYINAYDRYLKHAEADPAWAEENPFYYKVYREGKDFQVVTNGEEKTAAVNCKPKAATTV